MSDINPFEKLLETPEPPELGPGPRAGVQTDAEVNRALEEAFRRMKLADEQQQLIRALLLLWHDHLETAHGIAQEIENADGAFVHGIMHRREPDYGNAKYWFRRVGQHEAFPEIAKRAASLPGLTDHAEFRERLIRSGEWDAFAFVDCCEEASGRTGTDSAKRLLRELQAIETRVLIEMLS
jgi:hypothetical protein